MNGTVEFRLNGQPVRVPTSSDRLLLWVLRGDLELTGTKYGCGIGLCGACTVLVGTRAVRACLTTVGEVAGQEVTTIEGMATGGKLHPLQQAFIDRGAFQCGYCTPGMILNAFGLLLRNPNPTEAQVAEELEGNLCRCGSHQRIVQAVLQAGAFMRGSSR